MMASPIGLPMIESGKVEYRFAQRFAWDRSMMNANAADATSAIDNRDSLAKLWRPGLRPFAQQDRSR